MELQINSAMGSMKEEIDINKEGKDIMIGFNPKFLIDALTHIFPLNEIEAAYDLFEKRRDGVMKVAITPPEQ